MGQPYMGEIRMFGGNFAPLGWALCQGQITPISGNEALFNLLGTTYGGDGVNTFALPNLQSRLPVHQGNSGGVGYVLGQSAGTETVTLLTNQLPSHSHTPDGSSSAGTQPSPSNGVWAEASINQYSNTAPSVAMAGSAIGNAGGNQPHDNMMPYLVINFIIAMNGVYPTQT